LRNDLAEIQSNPHGINLVTRSFWYWNKSANQQTPGDPTPHQRVGSGARHHTETNLRCSCISISR